MKDRIYASDLGPCPKDKVVESEMECCEWCGKRHFLEDMERIVKWPGTSGDIYVCHKCKDGETVCPDCKGLRGLNIVDEDQVLCLSIPCPTCHGNGIVPGEKD